MSDTAPSPSRHIPQLFFSAALISVFCLVSAPAYASSPMASVLCTIVGLISGTIGRGLGTMAIVMLCGMAMFGRASWGMALTICVGVGVILNAPGVFNGLFLFAGWVSPC
ncbi:MAG: TrbC/VirB2 family protein, partial [Pseudomonadota bacterium]|nr:TrbC/VirB2 family protein [Pseudomonadota bacterium]